MNRFAIMSKGDEITKARMKNGLTQAELARRCNLTKGAISRVEKGNAVTPSTAKAITDTLGTEFEDCFTFQN